MLLTAVLIPAPEGGFTALVGLAELGEIFFGECEQFTPGLAGEFPRVETPSIGHLALRADIELCRVHTVRGGLHHDDAPPLLQ